MNRRPCITNSVCEYVLYVYYIHYILYNNSSTTVPDDPKLFFLVPAFLFYDRYNIPHKECTTTHQRYFY
jgi:hypothetical protein